MFTRVWLSKKRAKDKVQQIFVIWRSARGSRLSWSARLAWVLAAALFGPFGLLAYVLAARKR